MIEDVLPFDRGTVAGHPYVAAGEGSETLVLIPGGNDPLCRVTDTFWYSVVAAGVCNQYATGDRRVMMVSRPRGLPADVTIPEMADGYADVLEQVGPADVFGLCIGGLIAQQLAADHPDLVETGIYAMMGERLDGFLDGYVDRWLAFAEEDRWEPIYEEAFLEGTTDKGIIGKSIRSLTWIYTRVSGPTEQTKSDFLATIRSVEAHSPDHLDDIEVPSLVLGTTDDPLISEESYRNAAERIDDCELYIMEEGSHEAVVNRRQVFNEICQDFVDDPASFDPGQFSPTPGSR